MKKGSKQIIALFSVCALIALPASAALYKGPPAYGEIVLSVEEHFVRADNDNSGLLSLEEYTRISAALKHQAHEDARLDFQAMDLNDDGWLDFDEFYGELPSALTV